MKWDSFEELQQAPVPSLLWHYTSLSGFRGIIESGKLFSTDMRFLNDTQELVHAMKLAREVLADSPILASTFRDLFHVSVEVEQMSHHRLILVTSFTEMGNQLSQWRGYANDGVGVSLGFELSELRKKGIVSQSYNYLVPCVYEECSQKHMLQDLLTPFENPDPCSRRLRVDEVGDRFLRMSPVMKNKSFEEEQEWRYVHARNNTNGIKFRTSKTSLIPYAETPIKRCLRRVLLGPGCDQQALLSANFMLEANGYKEIMVEKSDVPYLPR